jgi:hypothetical protein
MKRYETAGSGCWRCGLHSADCAHALTPSLTTPTPAPSHCCATCLQNRALEETKKALRGKAAVYNWSCVGRSRPLIVVPRVSTSFLIVSCSPCRVSAEEMAREKIRKFMTMQARLSAAERVRREREYRQKSVRDKIAMDAMKIDALSDMKNAMYDARVAKKRAERIELDRWRSETVFERGLTPGAPPSPLASAAHSHTLTHTHACTHTHTHTLSPTLTHTRASQLAHAYCDDTLVRVSRRRAGAPCA